MNSGEHLAFSPITLAEMSRVKLMNRTDTKFVTTERQLTQLLRMAQADYLMQEIDGQRVANYYTCYFDTPQMDMFCRHLHGHANRQKVRIRSYVDSKLHFLEVKTKDNHRRTKKKRIALEGLGTLPHTDEWLPVDRLDGSEPFLKRVLRYDARMLRHHLDNRFCRVTLVNKALTERLTIDTGLAFSNRLTGQQRSLEGLVIIELKRDGLQPSPVLAMLGELRIKPMGFSKYCMGAAMTNPDLPRNRFKPRLHAVERMLAAR